MLATVAHDHLKSLAALTNETAHLAVREGRSALFIDHASFHARHRHIRADRGTRSRLLQRPWQGPARRFRRDRSEGFRRRQAAESLYKKTITTIKGLAAACGEIKKRGMPPTTVNTWKECVAWPLHPRIMNDTVIGFQLGFPQMGAATQRTPSRYPPSSVAYPRFLISPQAAASPLIVVMVFLV